MTTKRSYYDDALKLEVAKMVADQGLPVTSVAQQMNVGRTASIQSRTAWTKWDWKAAHFRAAKNTAARARKSSASIGQ